MYYRGIIDLYFILEFAMTVLQRSFLAMSMLAFASSLIAQEPAQIANNQQQMMPQQQAMPQNNQQQFAPRYVQQPNNVWNQPAYNPNYFNRSPWSNSMPMPWNNGSNGNGFTMPWNNGSNMPWNGNNNNFNMPWNNNGGNNNFFPRNFNGGNNFPNTNFNGPWNNGSNAFPTVKGPWNNGWGSAPWSKERWQNDPMGSPSKWINFDDPKEGVAEMWEDAIKGPHRLGRMPGGWTAPSISVPNPVDVTDTFGQRWRGLPTEISEEADNFTYNVVK